jgi:UDP-2,4-diacetamido-2,4,6-trideoxy-beta-L-altropyranose hydrolase
LKRRVILRADGNSKIGLGHVHRIYALAQILQPHFDCIINIQEPSSSIYNLFGTKFIVHSLPNSIYGSEAFYNELVNEVTDTDIVVLDGYGFNTEYQRRLKARAYKLISIDDIHQTHFLSDVIINHSGGITDSDYDYEPDSVLLLGPAYTLIKKEFLHSVRKENLNQFPPSILINFGGADPQNKTLTTLESLLNNFLDFGHLHIIVGSAYLYLKELQQVIKSAVPAVFLHTDCTTEEVISIMHQCNVAILAPSTILFEYSTIRGLAFIEQTADNQKDVYDYFISSQLALPVSDLNEILMSEKVFLAKASKLIANQNKVFDRKSGDRLLKIFMNL